LTPPKISGKITSRTSKIINTVQWKCLCYMKLSVCKCLCFCLCFYTWAKHYKVCVLHCLISALTAKGMRFDLEVWIGPLVSRRSWVDFSYWLAVDRVFLWTPCDPQARQGFGLVVKAADWHAGDPGSNPRQGRPIYIRTYTPSAVSILGMDMCAI
jgi:hypothetical protein